MQMLSEMFRLGLCLTLVSMPLLSHGEDRLAGSFGDWSKICSPTEQGELCQLSQTVNQNDSGKRLFETAVGYVPGTDNPVMFLTAPLGIFIPRGITLELTEDTMLSTAVQRCDANGCLAVTTIDPEFLEEMKGAKDGRLIFGASADQNMAVPLSLMGFTAGMASLERFTPPTTPAPAAKD